MAKGDTVQQEQNIAGTSSGYVTGDVIGTETTFTGFATAAGGTGTITKVAIWDDADALGAIDLYFAKSTASPATDSTAFAPSDANNRLYVVHLVLPAPFDNGGARELILPVMEDYVCASTSLFLTIVSRATAGTIAANAIRVGIWATLTS